MTKFNVNFSDLMYVAIAELADRGGTTKAEVIRDALSLYWWLAQEYRLGAELLIARPGGQPGQIVVPGLERMRGREEVPRLD